MAADTGNHAEGAAIVAAVLNFEIGASAIVFVRARIPVGRFEDGRGEQFGVGEDVGDKDRVLSSQFPVLSKSGKRQERFSLARVFIEDEFSELMLVRVADHSRDAGERADFFRSALRVTSRDDNSCQRILPLHAADGGAGVLICRSSDGASIQ